MSVILALTLLFIFFEGRINFLANNTMAKRLAYAWIALNLLLVLITAYKNWLYVAKLGITYKRIGVWYYLLASITAFWLMWIKIREDRNFLFMIRKSVYVFILVLVSSSLLPWELAVTTFNLRQAEKKVRKPDIEYLLRLDGHQLHLVKAYTQRHSGLHDSCYIEDQMVTARINNYMLEHRYRDWPSMVLMENHSYNKLRTIAK